MPLGCNHQTGYVMPAWYDILEMSFERKIDTAQIGTIRPRDWRINRVKPSAVCRQRIS